MLECGQREYGLMYTFVDSVLDRPCIPTIIGPQLNYPQPRYDEPRNRIYLIGSLSNPEIPKIGNALRSEGFEVFDDWYAAGPEADDHWQAYETQRGRTYSEALQGYAAKNVYAFDKRHMDRCDIGVLVLPAGKSGHMELGWMKGKGKRTYVLVNEDPERWDVMYNFHDGVAMNYEELVEMLKRTLH